MKLRRDGDLLELEDVERRLRPFSRHYVGVRPIPLANVVGTDGKVGAFTRRTCSNSRARGGAHGSSPRFSQAATIASRSSTLGCVPAST